MRSRGILLTGLLALLIPVGVMAQSTTQDPDVNDLRKQLEEMRSQMAAMQNRIEQMEKAKAGENTNPLAEQPSPQPATAKVAAPAKPAAPKSPTAFSSGDWTFKIGGYIKLDMIHDFNAIGSTDTFNPRTIPVDGSAGQDTRIHARETRLNLTVTGPVDGRELKFFIEGDFMGTNNGLRLRHAYGEYGGLLAGQTWTTFMDDTNIPNTFDLDTPLAAPNLRVAMLRYTFRPSKQNQFSFALEDPDPEVNAPPGVPGKAERTLPDFTGRWRYTNGRGHIQLSGFLGRTRFRPNKGEPTDVTIYGGLASGRLRVFTRDAAYAQFGYGPGLGRYRGDVSAAPDTAGHLKAVKVAALTVGYEHYWSPRWSSNFVASPAWIINDDLGPTFHRRLDYLAANLRYWFLENRAWIGAEYLYGRREVRNGDSGSANRIQGSVRFNLP